MEGRKEDYEKLERLKEQYEKHEMTDAQKEAFMKRIKDAKTENRQRRWKKGQRALIAAAAVVAVFILLPNMSKDIAYAMGNLPVVGGIVKVVTFRDYQYEAERHNADISVPEIVPGEDLAVADGSETATDGGTETAENKTTADDTTRQETLKKTTDEINAEIQQITDEIIAEFEEFAADEEGYQDVVVKSEILATSERYFTLKLICYQGAGSGAEWDYFYTIDLDTGERIALPELFEEGSDYIGLISENIKEQMRTQMKEDDSLYYWVDETDVPEWNFKQITDETSFYLNQDGNVVICFNEGDVAPMYMGCVEFVIPDEVLSEIRK